MTDIVYAVRCKGNDKFLCGTIAKDREFYQGFVDLKYARLYPTKSGATTAMKSHQRTIDAWTWFDWPDDTTMEIVPIKLEIRK